MVRVSRMNARTRANVPWETLYIFCWNTNEM